MHDIILESYVCKGPSISLQGIRSVQYIMFTCSKFTASALATPLPIYLNKR